MCPFHFTLFWIISNKSPDDSDNNPPMLENKIILQIILSGIVILSGKDVKLENPMFNGINDNSNFFYEREACDLIPPKVLFSIYTSATGTSIPDNGAWINSC